MAKLVRYSEAVRRKVVLEMLEGQLTLNEAMDKYGIATGQTIVRWLRQYRERAESSANKLNEDSHTSVSKNSEKK